METYFYHTDYLGSVRMISDVTGTVVWEDRYEPFGEDEAQSGSIENTYKFTGKGKDPDTGLFYFNARWYDPDLDRFINEDPLWGSIFDPQSLNRFAYGDIDKSVPLHGRRSN
jgi:RHS repeat-associated protein